MAQQQNVLFSKPPPIDVEKFGIWTELFECHVRGKSQKIWDIITNGNFIPTKIENDLVVEKSVKDWTPTDESLFCLNFEAKNILYAALNSDEIERVFTCRTANDIWQSLNDTHRGNTQVKSSKINILVHDYELFEMSKDESIDSMFKRFNLIMTTLKGLGRTYPNEDYVRKILRALPPEWMPKITSLEDSRDLSTMKLDDLIGNLKVHEIALKRNKVREQVTKKSIALKAAVSSDEEKKEKEEEASSSDDETENFDDISRLVRMFSKFLSNKRSARNDRSNINRRDGVNRDQNQTSRFPRRNGRPFQRFNNNRKNSDNTSNNNFCYVCGDKNHYANACPKRAKQIDAQKAFVGGTWSASEDEDEGICLMADHENEVSTSCFNNYDSDYSNCSDNYYNDDMHDDENLDELEESFNKMVALANRYKDENAKLNESLLLCKNEIHDSKQTIACDFKIKKELNDKITILEKKVCEKDVCNSCITLIEKVEYLENKICENDICAKCDFLKDEIACLKAKCESHEKDNLLANAFQNSNEKVVKMLNMSNRINCRKGIGSDTCIDTCSCVQIKRCFEPPKIETRKPYVQKPLYVSKMNNMNYMPRKPYACMYNSKFSRPKNNVNLHASFYVYDKYDRKIKMVRKWIPKGMFNIDNPGGMRLWF